MRLRHGMWLSVALAGLLPVMAAAQQNPQQQRPAAGDQSTPQEAGDIGASPLARVSGTSPSDAQLAAWLVIENDLQRNLSSFAAEGAQDKRVQDFARRLADHHQQLAQQLNKPLQQAMGVAESEEFDFGEVLDEIATRIEETRPRGARTGAENEPAENREEISEAREGVTDERQEARRERRLLDRRRSAEDRPANEVRDEREDVREAREGVREERRGERLLGNERDRRALPLLRENLPQILDTLGEAIQGGGTETSDFAVLRLKRSIARKSSDSIKQELERQEGKGFDQAYLGFVLVSHLELVDALEVAQQHASSDFQPVLRDAQSSVQDHLQEARELMRAITP